MTTKADPIQLLDQVLSEVEAGHAADAILMLSGMLDASLAKGYDINCWRSSLITHPLYKLLTLNLRRLSISTKPESSDQYAEVGARKSATASSSGKISDGFSKLGFVRALDARRSLSMQTVAEAWRGGKQVALHDCGERGELKGLFGCDTSNIIIIHHDKNARSFLRNEYGRNLTVEAGSHSGKKLRGQFDLILANNIADRLDTHKLAIACRGFAKQLKPGGRLILSAFATGHLGQGLQQLCMNPALICHAEPALEAVAKATGLSITHFRDSSNSLIWAELRGTRELGQYRGATS